MLPNTELEDLKKKIADLERQLGAAKPSDSLADQLKAKYTKLLTEKAPLADETE